MSSDFAPSSAGRQPRSRLLQWKVEPQRVERKLLSGYEPGFQCLLCLSFPREWKKKTERATGCPVLLPQLASRRLQNVCSLCGNSLNINPLSGLKKTGGVS